MELLTLRDIAERRGVPYETARRWVKNGYLPGPANSHARRSRRWQEAVVRQWSSEVDAIAAVVRQKSRFATDPDVHPLVREFVYKVIKLIEHSHMTHAERVGFAELLSQCKGSGTTPSPEQIADLKKLSKTVDWLCVQRDALNGNTARIADGVEAAGREISASEKTVRNPQIEAAVFRFSAEIIEALRGATPKVNRIVMETLETGNPENLKKLPATARRAFEGIFSAHNERCVAIAGDKVALRRSRVAQSN